MRWILILIVMTLLGVGEAAAAKKKRVARHAVKRAPAAVKVTKTLKVKDYTPVYRIRERLDQNIKNSAEHLR